MKAMMIIFLVAISNLSMALELEVISTEIALNDENGQPTLCLLVAQDLETKNIYGLVEDITDCFYTRKALRQNSLKVDSNFIEPMPPSKLKDCLQSWAPQLVLLISTAE